jgi:TetR/AcrR family acrAB operon transcriptional repressor
MYIMVTMRRTKEEAEATRGALVEAALAVFAERGYAAATLADIAARAGVTRGAAYHHFKDKAELYATTVAHHWKEVPGPIWRHLDDDAAPLDRIRRFLVAYFTALEHDARFQTLLEVVMFRTEALPELDEGLNAKDQAIRAWTARLASILSLAAGNGELRPNLPVPVAACAVISYVTGVSTTYLICRDLMQPAHDAEDLADALLAGFS